VIHRYTVTVGGRGRLVELEELGGDQFRVVIDGRERRLEGRRVAPGMWSLLDGTRVAVVDVDGAAPALTLALADGTGDRVVVAAEIVDARSAGLAAMARRGTAAAAGPVALRSPMPGRVVKILAKTGEPVEAGAGLVVVEAMKMENELRAPRGGIVRQVKCTEGAAVEAGQELVVIE